MRAPAFPSKIYLIFSDVDLHEGDSIKLETIKLMDDANEPAFETSFVFTIRYRWVERACR